MKLVVFGLTVSSSWGNGHATLWRGLCAALGRRGHRTVFFERNVPYYASHRDTTEPEGCDLELYADWDSVADRARRETADADVAMVTSYCPDARAAADLILEGARLSVFYDLDTPVTLAALRDGAEVPYIGGAGLAPFDLVLSYTGGRALTELRQRLGARRVAPLYGSVDTGTHRPAAPLEYFRADLSYLGTYAPDRQAVLETLFIEPARRLSRRRFIIGGAQYPQDFPWSSNIYFVRHLAPSLHASFYCSSRLTLNVTRRAMADMGYCPSGRLFEAAACGAPILSDDWEGLDRFFEPGREILIARTPEDTAAALDRSDAELSAIALAARARTLCEHTAERRARDLEELLGSCTSAGAPEPEPLGAGPASPQAGGG